MENFQFRFAAFILKIFKYCAFIMKNEMHDGMDLFEDLYVSEQKKPCHCV